MPKVDRNVFIDDGWTLRKVISWAVCDSFDCGDCDLNEYFHEDAFFHREEFITQTYYLHLSKYPDIAIALLDFCNDSVKLNSYRDAIEIDERKRYPNLPAVKLTRFGVQKEYQRMSIGSHVLNMIKELFVTDNRTGCRFVTVDAYNNSDALGFYTKNGFKPFTDKDKDNKTRALFFDLKRFNEKISPI